VAARPPSPSFPFFRFYYLPLYLNHLLQIGEVSATWVGRSATYLGQPATPWLPYKRAAKGSLVLHTISSQAKQNFLNPSPSS
jgi:hypothetical protein